MINKIIEGYLPQLTAIRHDIHQHPELGFEEFRTSDLVADYLNSWGYEVHRGLAGTGVVGTLRVGDGVKRLGLRADMDALPIEENNGKPWSSSVANRMHACGHDGHTTMLLGAARYLAQTRNFNGTLHLIFQPAEEMLNGGARMVEQGLFERFPCDAIFAMHNMPGMPLGEFFFQHGPFMALDGSVQRAGAGARRPRCHSAADGRSGAGGFAYHRRAAEHRFAQYRSAGGGGDHRRQHQGR